MRAFGTDRELSSGHMISWNHVEFEVMYECLSEEIKIGDYYERRAHQISEFGPLLNAISLPVFVV